MALSPSPSPSSAELRARFDVPSEPTVGLEEEIMVLDAGTLDLAPRAGALLGRAGGDPRLKGELVAAQVEIATPPCDDVATAVAHLAEGRRALAAAAGDELRLACAGAHPFAATEGELAPGPRYDAIAAEYGVIARRQLVCALQVHVAVRPAGLALAVHDALRSFLPEIAALSANAPFHGGRDTGLASVRPTIGEQLPRQGVPPALGSWEAYAQALAWVGDQGAWWWEARLHPLHATIELRVPDAQATLADARAVAELAHAAIRWLAARARDGEELAVADTWRIEENRWSALRHGLAGEMRDLATGEREATASRVARLLDAVQAATGAPLDGARALLETGGPAARWRAAAGGDAHAATAWLAGRFLAGAERA